MPPATPRAMASVRGRPLEGSVTPRAASRRVRAAVSGWRPRSRPGSPPGSAGGRWGGGGRARVAAPQPPGVAAGVVGARVGAGGRVGLAGLGHTGGDEPLEVLVGGRGA